MMMAMTKTELAKLLRVHIVRSHFERGPICVNIAKQRPIKLLLCQMKVIACKLIFYFFKKNLLELFNLNQKYQKCNIGRDWKCRAPPRGYTADTYTLCENFMDNASCHYGNQCVEAHGNDELVEWQERFEYRKMRMQRACEKELFGKSFTEQLLEQWVSVNK